MEKTKEIIKPEVREIIPSVTTIPGGWILKNSIYRGEPHMFYFSNELTKPLNAQQLSEDYNNQKQKGNPYPATSLILWSGFDTAAQSGHAYFMNFLKESIRRYSPNTLSKIAYSPDRNGEVIHNFGTQDNFSLQGKLIGPDNRIRYLRGKNKEILKLILGTDNISEINKISKKINETEMHLWRLNQNPNNLEERLVRFDAYSDRLDLDCYRNLFGGCPAFRVLQVD